MFPREIVCLKFTWCFILKLFSIMVPIIINDGNEGPSHVETYDAIDPGRRHVLLCQGSLLPQCTKSLLDFLVIPVHASYPYSNMFILFVERRIILHRLKHIDKPRVCSAASIIRLINRTWRNYMYICIIHESNEFIQLIHTGIQLWK